MRAFHSLVLVRKRQNMLLRVVIPSSILLALGIPLTLAWPLGTAAAATLSVNTTGDVVADDGQCSLREAIMAADGESPFGSTEGECPADSYTLFSISLWMGNLS